MAVETIIRIETWGRENPLTSILLRLKSQALSIIDFFTKLEAQITNLDKNLIIDQGPGTKPNLAIIKPGERNPIAQIFFQNISNIREILIGLTEQKNRQDW
jgi:hypothetical protein